MWKQRKNTVESWESNRKQTIAQDQRGDPTAWKKAFGKWHKSHQHLEGVQKPHRFKAFGVAEGPVY